MAEAEQGRRSRADNGAGRRRAPRGTWRSPKRDSERAARRKGAPAAAIQRARALGWFGIGLGLAQIVAPRSLGRLVGVSAAHVSPTFVRLLGVREVITGVGLLTTERAGWAWGRVAGDAMDLAILGSLAGSGRVAPSRLAATAAAVAGVTALDVATAAKLGAMRGGIHLKKAFTINRPAHELYRFWRDFENLPRFMAHLEAVHVTDERHSRWRAKGPAGLSIEWDAEIVDDRTNELISWRTAPGAIVHHRGTVRFSAAPGGRGTEVRVEMEYGGVGHRAGAAIASLFGREPSQQVEGDLRRFKQVMETGDVVHSDASIHRGPHPGRPPSGPIELPGTLGGAGWKGGAR